MLSRILVLTIVFGCSASAFANNCDYENILFSHLAKQYKSTKNCFLIDPKDESVEGEGVLSVKVRERHNEKCGGDPDTSPSAGIFEVHIKSCEIKKLNMAEGLYEILD